MIPDKAFHVYPYHYSDFPDDESEWEYTQGNVSVSKVGGGTLGRSYDGDWHYRFTFPNGDTRTGSDLRTGTPKSHEEAADIVTEFLTTD